MDKNAIRKALFIWILIIIALIYSLLSCSPVKKLNRLQKNHSYLFEKKIDTIKIYDTSKIVIPGVKLDSTFPLFKMSAPGGISFSKENLHINLFHDTITNYIELDAQVDTVYRFIYREIKIPYNRFVVDPPENLKSRYIIIVYLIIFLIPILLLSIYLFKNRKKLR